MKTRRVVSICVLVLVGCVMLFVLMMRGIVLNTVEDPPANSPYVAEVLAVRDLFGVRGTDEPPASSSYEGPGSSFIASPDGRYLAFMLGAARAFHTTVVWDERNKTETRVVSVQEVDPGSGSSHRMMWSRDSKAVLIFGQGKLPLRWTWEELRLVYEVGEGRLYSARGTPP